MSSPNGTQAIDRAAMLLAQVVHGSEPVSFTELTAACGLAKSTTSRLLTALERHQLVRRDGDGRFWPGELFVRYASRSWPGWASRPRRPSTSASPSPRGVPGGRPPGPTAALPMGLAGRAATLRPDRLARALLPARAGAARAAAPAAAPSAAASTT